MNRRDLLQRLAAAAGAGAAAKAGVIDLTKVASVAEPKKVSLLVPGLYSYNTLVPVELSYTSPNVEPFQRYPTYFSPVKR